MTEFSGYGQTMRYFVEITEEEASVLDFGSLTLEGRIAKGASGGSDRPRFGGDSVAFALYESDSIRDLKRPAREAFMAQIRADAAGKDAIEGSQS